MLGPLLRFYFDRGMRLVKLHQAIRFKFSPYVASYIANNTSKRQQFKQDDVKKAFYKLMNNAPYKKTIEDVALRTDIRPLNDMEKARKLTEKQHCIDFRVFDGQVAPPEKQVEAAAAEEQQQQEALVGIEMCNLYHFINKPFANGFFVLVCSKLKCMRFVYFCLYLNTIKTFVSLYRYTFYAFLKEAFRERVRMLYTDTDSFFLYFCVEDLAKEINARPNYRDAFDFTKISSRLLSNLVRENAKLQAGNVGYFKDKTKSNPIVEFVGLSPNMYSFTVCDAFEPTPRVNYPINVRHKAVTKGVARSKIKRFKQEEYLRMYNGGALTNVVNRRIGSKLH